MFQNDNAICVTSDHYVIIIIFVWRRPVTDKHFNVFRQMAPLYRFLSINQSINIRLLRACQNAGLTTG